MRSKLKIIIPIAAAIIAIVLAAIFIQFKPANVEDVSLLVKTAQKYLLEMNYEQAIVEFEKSIALDPMNADAYIGLAEAYSGMGDVDKAVETLKLGYERTGDERLKALLEELSPSEETEVTSAKTTTVTTASETVTEAPKPEYVYMYVPNKVEYETAYDYGYHYNHVEFDYYGYTINFDYDENGNIEEWGVSYYKPIYKSVAYSSNSQMYEHDSIVIFNGNTEDSIVPITMFEKTKKENEKNIEAYSGGGMVYADVEYKHDENGTLIEVIDYYAGTDDIYSYSKYDNHGNKIKYFSDDHEAKISYVYNSDGSVAECTYSCTFDYTSYYSTSVFKYTYDSNGNCTKVVENYTYNDTERETITEYFYNDDKNIIKEVRTTNGEKGSAIVYEYDSNGNLISKTETASNGDVTESEKYSYIRIKVLRSEVEKVKNEFGIELNVFEIAG